MNLKSLILTASLVVLMFGCSSPGGGTVEETSDYRVILEISANTTVYANARVYDYSNNFVNGVSISVDGVQLEKQSYDGYHANIAGSWADDSTHTFVITTPDGVSESGNISKPIGSISGVTYSPPKGTIATSYTVSPPSGGWPSGSYIYCEITKEGPLYYGVKEYPTGVNPITVDSTHLIDAIAVSFSASLRNEVYLSNYSTGSLVSVAGTATSW